MEISFVQQIRGGGEPKEFEGREDHANGDADAVHARGDEAGETETNKDFSYQKNGIGKKEMDCRRV